MNIDTYINIMVYEVHLQFFPRINNLSIIFVFNLLLKVNHLPHAYIHMYIHTQNVNEIIIFEINF